MKLTKTKLRQIIKEELLNESTDYNFIENAVWEITESPADWFNKDYEKIFSKILMGIGDKWVDNVEFDIKWYNKDGKWPRRSETGYDSSNASIEDAKDELEYFKQIAKGKFKVSVKLPKR